MEIDFYFDPSCPWCWVTSRWLVEVSENRDLQINWLPFSLAIKNGELNGEDVTGHLDTHTIAHQVLRIIEAIHSKEGIDRGVLFTEFGKSYFIDKKLDDDIFMAAVIKRLGLEETFLHEANNWQDSFKKPKKLLAMTLAYLSLFSIMKEEVNKGTLGLCCKDSQKKNKV